MGSTIVRLFHVRAVSGILVALTLVATGCGANSGSSGNAANGATAAGSPATPAVGQKAGVVSGIEYTVDKVSTNKTLGDPNLGGANSKNGTFVLVDLTLHNTTNETYTFAAPETVWIKTKNQRKYDPSTETGLGLGDKELFTAQLAPGKSQSGTIAFDLPLDEVAGAVLHVEEELIDPDHKLAVPLGL